MKSSYQKSSNDEIEQEQFEEGGNDSEKGSIKVIKIFGLFGLSFKEKKISTLIHLMLLILLILLILIIFFIFKTVKLNSENNRLISETKKFEKDEGKEIEAKNKEIKDKKEKEDKKSKEEKKNKENKKEKEKTKKKLDKKDEEINELIEHSKVLEDKTEYLSIINHLNEIFRDIKKVDRLIPLYSASECKYDTEIFHNICDKYSNTLVLIKTEKKNKFGGFTTQTWAGDGFKPDKYAFTFSLSQNYFYDVQKGRTKYAIKCGNDFGPAFGKVKEKYHNIYIEGSKVYTTISDDKFGHTFDFKGLKKPFGKTEDDFKYVKSEYEVYRVVFEDLI